MNKQTLNRRKTGITLREFSEMWDEVDRVTKGRGNKVVIDINGTEIEADNYEVEYYDGVNRDTLIILYHKGEIVAEIKLKYIKGVY